MTGEGNHDNWAQQQRKEEMAVRANVVEEAVTDSAWWSWLLTMDKLFEIVRMASAWVEGCWCHDI
eukprot:10317947-Lingulodinium_polyedra.AAC.1